MVSVVRPAGSLAGYHTWSFRVLRRADFAEKAAFRRGHDSTENLSALTPRMLFHCDRRHRKPVGRVELPPPRTKVESAFRNNPDPAPGGISRFEDLVNEFARRRISFPGNSPAVLVHNFGPPAFDLVDQKRDALQNVHRFEAGNHARRFIIVYDFLVCARADYYTDVTRAYKPVQIDLASLEERSHHWWKQLVGR